MGNYQLLHVAHTHEGRHLEVYRSRIAAPSYSICEYEGERLVSELVVAEEVLFGLLAKLRPQRKKR